MSTRLLKDLESRAAAAKDDAERLQIRAERAGALARLGRIDEARGEIARLRHLNHMYSPALTAWILFAEGLIEHFAALSPLARDRYNRAYAIAASLGDKRLRGLSSAWLASWEFREGDLDTALRKAVESVVGGDGNDHATLSRAYLVIAGCLGIAGDALASNRLFSLARTHAVNAGDIGLQSVILHNMAAAKLNRLTIEHAFGLEVTEDSKQIELELQSISSLEAGMGLTTLKAGTGLIQAQLHMCKEQWSDALSLFATNFEDSLRQGHDRWRARSLADMSLCAAMLGDTNSSMRMGRDAKSSIQEIADADDLAITHARLAESFRTSGADELAETHQELALKSLTAFRESQNKLLVSAREALNQVGNPIKG